MKSRKELIKMFILMLTMLSMMIWTSCSEDEPEPEDSTDEIKLVAAFSFTPESPTIGEEVTLDATTSFNESTTGFDIEWAFTAIPEGSDVEISNASAIQANFTPDKIGDYAVDLTITSLDGEVSDTKSSTITVIPGGFLRLNGTIDSDRTLENINEDDASLIDYLVDGNVQVLAGLTIQPGVRIAFQEDMALNITSTGTLVAEGTATDSIVFEPANKAGELYWKGIYIASSSNANSISYAHFSLAGNSNFDFTGQNYSAAIGIESTGNVSISNSTFIKNKGYAVYVDDNGGRLNKFSNNHMEANDNGVATWANEVTDIDNTSTFVNNTQSDVEIFSSNLLETEETTWNALSEDATYTISGGIEIGGTLTIEAGAKFEVDEDVLIYVTGAMIVNGAENQLVEFTSSNISQDLHWKGILIVSGDSRNAFNYSSISYAGNSNIDFTGENYPAAIGVDEGGKVSVTNSTLHDNKGYALYIDDQGGLLAEFANNHFENNDNAVGLPANEVEALDEATTFSSNSFADVEIFRSDYDANKTSSWVNLNSNAAYTISGNIEILGDLTINPGVDIELDENVLFTVSGSLSAIGSDSDRITFTSSNVIGGLLWKGIYIPSASSLNHLDYCDISYAGNSVIDFTGDNYAAAVGVDLGGKVSISNSSISNNADYGLYVDDQGGILETFANNTFSSNQRAVGVPADEVDAMDGNTTFTNNSYAEVEIFGSNQSDNKDVTWNALSNDASYRVTGNLYLEGTTSVAAGSVFEMNEDIVIEVRGAFIAEGTASNMIKFTSSNISGNLHWKGLFFVSSNSMNSLDYTEVSYAGNSQHDFTGPNFAASVGVEQDAQLSVTNCTISNSKGWGLYSIGVLTASNNTFTNNVEGDSN